MSGKDSQSLSGGAQAWFQIGPPARRVSTQLANRLAKFEELGHGMAMHFKSFVHERLMVIRWLQPSVEATRVLTGAIARQYAAVQAPLCFAGVVAARCPTPDARTREALQQSFDTEGDRLGSVHMVVLGSSIRQSLMRSVLVNVALASRIKARRPIVDGSAESFARAMQERLGLEPSWLLPRLVDAGIIMPDELAPSR